MLILAEEDSVQWTAKKREAALLLAEGLSNLEVAQKLRIHETTICRWKRDPEFAAELDRLVLLTGVALQAERILIAKRIIRKKMETLTSKEDLLAWLKYVQSEVAGGAHDLADRIASVMAHYQRQTATPAGDAMDVDASD